MTNSFHSIELSALVEFLKNSWDFIHNRGSKNKSDINLSKTPWYLVIGPESTGKTKLIKETGLSWISEAQHLAIDPKDEDSHHKRCNLWVAKECILLDVPGNYFSADESPDYICWPEFLQQIQKYNKQKPFAGIVLTLDILAFAKDKASQNVYLQNIRKLLLALTKILTLQCPLFIIVTKLDKVAGFFEFFSDLGQEERSQPFGFEFGHSATLNLANIFKLRMEQMLKRLHERVIWRLHQERKEQKRTLIQNFPLQLESLQTNLGAFIYQLADVCGTQNKLPLQGIYFVSNCQENQTTDILHKTISHGLTIPAIQENLIALTPHPQTFFSQQLFKKILGSKIGLLTEQISTKRSRKLRLTIYAIASGLIITSSAVLAYNFNHKISLINQAQSALTNYRLLAAALPAHDGNIDQTLPALNALQLAVSDVKKAHLPVLLQDFSHANSLKELAEKTYHQALNNYFLQSMGATLEQILNNSEDPDTLYSTLKIYLMLGDPSHFDAQDINNWFGSYWNQSLSNNPALKQQLESHLAALLSRPVTPLELNQATINRVRAYLNSQPPVLLAYSIVKNQTDAPKINPFESPDDKKAFDQVFSSENSVSISTIFTVQQFRNIYFIKIPEACTTVVNGSDWVLGVSPRNFASVADKQALIASVQELYLRDYANNWQSLLVNLDILGWENLAQADATLSALLSDQSPLIHILRITADNTSLDKLTKAIPELSTEDIAAIKANLSFQFDDLSLLLSNAPNNTNSLDHILVNLTQLRGYIDQIYTSNDPNHASFLAAKKHFANRDQDPIGTILNSSPSLPEPARDWLNSLATNSWRLILENTQTFLNNTWQTTILPVYNANLINRYPLDRFSNQDVDIDAFTTFFGPDGLIDNYANSYLNYFIDKSSAQWQAKRLDGQALNISDEFLKQLERASLIQTMYFGNQSKPNVTFSLQPLALEPGVQQFQLDINGQKIETAQNASTMPIIVAWTGTSSFKTITLTFTNASGAKTTSTFTGPWSLFKLIDQSNLETMNDTKHYELTFDLDGNDARYQLLATNTINPFISGIINTYHCPEQLNNKSATE